MVARATRKLNMPTIRNESAHSINGVDGRRFAVITWPENGRIANQKWLSESRPIACYGPGATMRVEMRFDDENKNGHSTFTITAEVRRPGRKDLEAGGCLHDEIAAVFPELAHLIRWHLVSTDGPLHYIANTIYHADEHGPNRALVYFTGSTATDPLGLANHGEKERLLGYFNADKAAAAEGQPGYRVEWDAKTAKTRNLAHARASACWPEATDEELCAPRAELEAALRARLPALLAEFRAAMDSCGFIWEVSAS